MSGCRENSPSRKPPLKKIAIFFNTSFLIQVYVRLADTFKDIKLHAYWTTISH